MTTAWFVFLLCLGAFIILLISLEPIKSALARINTILIAIKENLEQLSKLLSKLQESVQEKETGTLISSTEKIEEEVAATRKLLAEQKEEVAATRKLIVEHKEELHGEKVRTLLSAARSGDDATLDSLSMNREVLNRALLWAVANGLPKETW